MTPQEAIQFLKETIAGCHILRDRQLKAVCEVSINALEKQIPKKPKTLNYGLLIEYGWKYECPNCGCAVGNNKNLAFAYGEYLNPYEDYCCSCGQALDWSDTE